MHGQFGKDIIDYSTADALVYTDSHFPKGSARKKEET